MKPAPVKDKEEEVVVKMGKEAAVIVEAEEGREHCLSEGATTVLLHIPGRKNIFKTLLYISIAFSIFWSKKNIHIFWQNYCVYIFLLLDLSYFISKLFSNFEALIFL
jgi:hypothetical protein